ncbi:hypothetical protein [Methyloceanibacter caenitepidi]|uniref:hypothetical protein n=1 Tax=Methyloceanibacter caenitepidi TaxID=1384459 RepID=UPI0005EF7012|nr:hypothetical protein [Methyloceanibacter caenitepidi]
MPIELSHLMQTLLGQKDALPVGDLPRPVAEHMRCHPAVVFLGSNEIKKIRMKHPEIGYEELQLLFLAIREGEYRTDDQRRERCATVFWTFKETGETFVVGLKSASQGGEVWVSTFHRISGRKLSKKIQRTKFLYRK